MHGRARGEDDGCEHPGRHVQEAAVFLRPGDGWTPRQEIQMSSRRRRVYEVEVLFLGMSIKMSIRFRLSR